jgi:uncharacterized protein YjbI with pentapeptide repeats
MSDIGACACGEPEECGRPGVSLHADGRVACLMHAPVAEKDLDAFAAEIQRILDNPPARKSFDFRDFHFPVGFRFPRGDHAIVFVTTPAFERATFHGVCDLRGAKFEGGANFEHAVFRDDVDFSDARFDFEGRFRFAHFRGVAKFARAWFRHTGNFDSATFGGHAAFDGAIFGGYGDFSSANFHDSAHFASTVFDEAMSDLDAKYFATADFRWARFDHPARVLFHRVNRGDIRQDAEKRDYKALCLDLLGANVAEVTFTDVHWLRTSGRITLYDEVRVRESSGRIYNLGRKVFNRFNLFPKVRRTTDHALVAAAYHALMRSFDASWQVELAEDCYVGAMEMTRLDPAQPAFQRFVLRIYRTISLYGSSYRRTFAMLTVLLVAFAAAFAMPQAGLVDTAGHTAAGSTWEALRNGMMHSIETATFQRDTWHKTITGFGRVMEILESVLVPSQLALFLFALRRRLKR